MPATPSEPGGAPVIATLAGYLALVYHEGRNVRHLIRRGHVESGPWERLRGLPTNREHAWAAVQPLRTKAAAMLTASKAARVFATQFAVDLDAMVALYDHPAWKNAGTGGNGWAGIRRAVRDLRDAVDAGNEQQIGRLLGSIPEMKHNTATVGEKLARLDRFLETAFEG